jgi:hypothetical protein
MMYLSASRHSAWSSSPCIGIRTASGVTGLC